MATRKANRDWCKMEEAIAAMAETPAMSGIELFCALFNSTPDYIGKQIAARSEGIAARDRARLAALAAKLGVTVQETPAKKQA